MAFRFVRTRGMVTSAPTVIKTYGSGTIYPGSVVEFSRINNRIEPASAASTSTNIFGVALDYIQGASDSLIRVIPFIPGQLWEADCQNIAATNQLFIKHKLQSSILLANSSYDQTSAVGIFLAEAISRTIYASLSSATMRIIGEFTRIPFGYGFSTTGYF